MNEIGNDRSKRTMPADLGERHEFLELGALLLIKEDEFMANANRKWLFKSGFCLLAYLMAGLLAWPAPQGSVSIHNSQFALTVAPGEGTFEITSKDLQQPVVKAVPGAKVNNQWIHSSDYPERHAVSSAFESGLGHGEEVRIVFSGLKDRPDLLCRLRLYARPVLGEIEVRVRNNTAKLLSVQAIRAVEAAGRSAVNLGSPEGGYRVLSDAYGLDPPVVRDLSDVHSLAPVWSSAAEMSPANMHRAVHSQLIYNPANGESLFFGALTAKRFLTILRLGVASSSGKEAQINSYSIDSTGTAEAVQIWVKGNNLMELSLPIQPGEELASEPVVFSTGKDYHAQLQAYADAVRQANSARFQQPNMIGWWSWTAFYRAISQGIAWTNAEWLAQHLKPLGYDWFFVDSGYQFARGDYTLPNLSQFPDGMGEMGYKVNQLGLKFGAWVAPFQISSLSSVYQHHPDWLVRNAQGEPIVFPMGKTSSWSVLDTTHPGAQDYLRETYRTMVRSWGVRYLKLDWLDMTTVEGLRYRPNTTAIEALRTGLEIIREAVGDDVVLDKDGGPPLPAVGLVDSGRIALDNAHLFSHSKWIGAGLAGRYYENQNFFRADPDAFDISSQLISDEPGLGSRQTVPLSYDEAETQIALAAISGGMYEIGDDLPTIAADPKRLELLKNPDLLQMAKLGRAAVPLDLMTFRAQDLQPSLFLLQESPRQRILAVFNWTDRAQSRVVSRAELRLGANGTYQTFDVLDPDRAVTLKENGLSFDEQPPHSVRIVKIIDPTVAAVSPQVTADIPAAAKLCQPIKFSAKVSGALPVLRFVWDFGDGTQEEGSRLTHTYTLSKNYRVRLVAEGFEGQTEKTFPISVTGELKTNEPQMLVKNQHPLLHTRTFEEPRK